VHSGVCHSALYPYRPVQTRSCIGPGRGLDIGDGSAGSAGSRLAADADKSARTAELVVRGALLGRDGCRGRHAFVAWVLWEGAALLGFVGVLISGASPPAITGLLAFVLLLLHGPSYVEERSV